MSRQASAGRSRTARGPWVALILIIASVLLWSALYGNLLNWVGLFGLVIFAGAGPLALAGTILAIAKLAARSRPIWVSILAIVLGLLALGYIGLEFLNIAAIAAFA